MDHLRRLIWFVVGVALAFVLVPSFAQTYQYTGKVQVGTGQAKSTTTYRFYFSAASIGITAGYSDWNSDASTACAQGFTAHVFGACDGYWRADYLNPHIAANGNCAYDRKLSTSCGSSGDAGTTSNWYQVAPETRLGCSSAQIEGQDGLCYSVGCPTVSPTDPNQNPWSEDPANSNQCRRVTSCPWAALWSDGTCSCPSSVVQVGAMFGSTRYTVPGNVIPGGSVCLGGCNVKAGESTTMITGGTTVSVITVAASSAPSSFCSPPPSPTPTNKTADQTSDAMVSCLQGGGSWGTVNGVGTCLAKGSGGTTTKYGTPTTSTETKTNPDGTTSTTTTTSTPVTTCTGGVCTTTTTTSSTVVTKDANGNVTGTTTTGGTSTGPGGGAGSGTGDGTGSSGFGGACSAGFSCDGDAVVCAIALEQHKRDCQLWDPGPAQNGPSTADAIGYYNSIGSMSAGALTASGGAISAPDQSTFIGGQGSLQDLTITVVGKQITVPLSTLNSVLQTIGMINVAVASVACVAIYRGGMG